MKPLINSGDLVTIAPVTEYTPLAVDDVVLCKVGGRYYLHLIKAVHKVSRYQIGNNHGHINGWVKKSSIFGVKINTIE